MKDLVERIKRHIDQGNMIAPAEPPLIDTIRDYSMKSTELLHDAVNALEEAEEHSSVDTSGVSQELLELLGKHLEDPVPGTPTVVVRLLRRLYTALRQPRPLKERTFSGNTYYTIDVTGHSDDPEQLLNQIVSVALKMTSRELTATDQMAVLRYQIGRTARESDRNRKDER